ncbi:MAG: hypothetical protein M0C28_23470 [Candidatus Moduliflexus flocculans]|nr:hypothetical protein [Candidatus Moduliflexus flocculans]
MDARPRCTGAPLRRPAFRKTGRPLDSPADRLPRDGGAVNLRRRPAVYRAPPGVYSGRRASKTGAAPVSPEP